MNKIITIKIIGWKFKESRNLSMKNKKIKK